MWALVPDSGSREGNERWRGNLWVSFEAAMCQTEQSIVAVYRAWIEQNIALVGSVVGTQLGVLPGTKRREEGWDRRYYRIKWDWDTGSLVAHLGLGRESVAAQLEALAVAAPTALGNQVGRTMALLALQHGG